MTLLKFNRSLIAAMPRAQCTSPRIRCTHPHSLTLSQVSLRQKLHILALKLLEHLRRLRVVAGLPLSPARPPDTSGIFHQLVYTGLGDVPQDDVSGIDHPRFGDLGRVQYKVGALVSLLVKYSTDADLQKPAYKSSPILLWDRACIPRALLESDAELLQLLRERARLNAKWND